nr:MAG TPA: hypothetical protein [Caudoviricetes sp.]
MNVKKILESTKTAIEDMNVSPDNLVLAITKLLEIAHAHGLDNEAVEALSECGITLEIEE